MRCGWPTGVLAWCYINGMPVYYGQPWVQINGAAALLSWTVTSLRISMRN